MGNMQIISLGIVDDTSVLPVTYNSSIGQQFKDPQQLQPEKIPPLPTLLILKAQTGFQFIE